MKKIDLNRKNHTYSENTHFYGRIWSVVSVVMMMVFPIAAGAIFDAWPTAQAIGIGITGILIYWAAGAVEFISYTPLLGATSVYLGFVTGNLSNLKVPCALSCLDAENVKASTDEGDIIATVSTAVSSIVTILVIIFGVILIAATPLAELLAKPAAQKAADYLLPALFGALAVVYISRNPKIAFPPVILMVVLCIAIPKIEGVISILVPFVAIFTVGVARIMYKKGWLDDKKQKAAPVAIDEGENASAITEATSDDENKENDID
ncbi:MAG: hypothetical protein MSH44_00315 [Christensenellaceae bacterium]|nr:hypothetical protein [Christensenellaceae bacterium]